MLKRLGEKMFDLKWAVGIAWIVLLAGLGVVAYQVGFSTTNDISIPGTKAQQALARFEELFPDTGTKSTKVVVAAPEGETLRNYQQEIGALTLAVMDVAGVTQAVPPSMNPAAISGDGTIGYILVQMEGRDGDGQVSAETKSGIETAMADARESGLTVEAGGDLATQRLGEILGIAEIAGLAIALLVLLVTLGTLVSAGMPLITAVISVAVSMFGLFSLSSTIELTNTAPVLAVMLGLAVGIDYSLFIINRYRTYVIDGYTLRAAAGRAIATAGNAVIFAAATVVVALAALSIVQIPFMTVMGLAAAGTVAIAALVAVTLIPAMLGIVGMRMFSKKTQKAILAQRKKGIIHHEDVSHSTRWYKLGKTIVRFRKTVLLGSILLVGALAWPATQLQLGLPTDETAAVESSQRKAYDLLSEGFGDGYNAPLLMVIEGIPEVTPELIAAFGQEGAPYVRLQQLALRVAEVEGVVDAQPALVGQNGTVGTILVTPAEGPSSQATAELVERIRSDATQATLRGEFSDVTIDVTGTTALQIDINKKLADALPIYLAVVVGLSFIILLVAFRSILIPLKATLGFLLSVAAMFGALVAVFQWGWFGIAEAPGPIVSFIPIIAIGILFGLAMDYEFFLVSGMQEAYHHTKKASRAVIDGFAIGSRVVVAAALIMVSVFAGFIGNHDATIQSIGFALALGVLVDAFIVRLLIVPVVMSYLGKSAWWLPKWLKKRLPHVSIEGSTK